MWKTSTRCCVIAIILIIRYLRMRCRVIRVCRLQFQWLLPSPTWILAIQPVLSLNAPSGGFWGDCSTWPTRYVAKDLEVSPHVDLWKNCSDQRSRMSYILKARHLSRYTVIAADIFLPGEQRNEDWKRQLRSASVLPFCIKHKKWRTMSILSARTENTNVLDKRT